MKRFLITLSILVVALLGIKFLAPTIETPTPASTAATFSDGTTHVDASFDNEAHTVTFTHEATGEITLPQAVSASGARYANEDESIVFWEHQGEVTITKDDETVFQGDVQEDVETPEEPSATVATPAELVGTWEWQKTEMNDDSEVVPTEAGAFTLTFAQDGRVSGTTDCNNYMGSVTVDGSSLSFGQLASTMMYCEGSQESVFTRALMDVATYVFDAEGNLVLNIKFDSGNMHFVKQ